MDVLYGCMDFSSSKIRESVKFDIRAYIERCRSSIILVRVGRR
jgi:hypothetical protein